MSLIIRGVRRSPEGPGTEGDLEGFCPRPFTLHPSPIMFLGSCSVPPGTLLVRFT